MHVVFRVDASTQIGSGHVIRCLTLAQALKTRKHSITFICRNLSGNLLTHIQQNNFEACSLDGDTEAIIKNNNLHTDWLQVSWQTDSKDTITAMQSLAAVDWLIVDHYAIDSQWEDSVRTYVKNLLVIDDLADRKHSAEILLDQNYYADMNDRYTSLLGNNTKQLIGPKYTLLRDEFIQSRNKARQRDGSINNVFIFFGGTDKENLTLKTLRSLNSIDNTITVNVIIGSTNDNKDEIIQYCNNLNQVTCHSHVNDISTFMLQADLALGAGGTTTWERCFLGLPTIVFTLAHNQAAVNEAVAHLGACLLAGDAHTSESNISHHIKKLLSHPKQVIKLSKAALSIIRNHVGAEGVVIAMENLRA